MTLLIETIAAIVTDAIILIILETGSIKRYNNCIVILLLFGKRGFYDNKTANI